MNMYLYTIWKKVMSQDNWELELQLHISLDFEKLNVQQQGRSPKVTR